MKPTLLKTLQDRLHAATWAEVSEMAEVTGVPLHTIAKIKRGETENPRIKTVEALLDYESVRRAPA